MKLNRRFLGAAALIASLQMISAGDITGKITLKGTPPPESNIPISPTDTVCGTLHPTKKTRLYVVGSAGELADTFVYIKEGLKVKEFPVPEKPALLDQVGCEYVPYVMGIQVNQQLLVRNSDPTLHNVNKQPAKPANKPSNMAQMASTTPPKSVEEVLQHQKAVLEQDPKLLVERKGDLKYSFPEPEMFLKFMCNVHPWMYGYVNVMPHPYFAVSGKDGTFQIKNVPPGKYTIEAHHRKAGKQTLEVEVKDTGAKDANFQFEIKK